jgi:DNA-binding beta-propeller fold protein YncE
MTRLPHRAVVTTSVLLMVWVAAGSAGVAAGSPRSGETWVSRYDGAAMVDKPTAVAVSPDGSRIFVTGVSAGVSSGNDYATLAYMASTGALLWAQRNNGTGNGDDGANSVAVSPDGSKVFVTGDSLADAYTDYVTVAYSAATGTVLWVKAYNGLGNLDDHARSVAVSPDGSRVFVTGESFGGAIGYDYATVAYSADNGATLWSKRYNGTANSTDNAKSLAPSPDGSTVYVTGNASMSGHSFDYVTIAYSAGTGAVVWKNDYNGTDSRNDVANSVAVSPDSSMVFVTGYSHSASTSDDYATIGINATTGGWQWLRRYKGSGSDIALSVTCGADGSMVYVTGYSRGIGTGFDYATLAYNASTGGSVWSKRYGGPADSEDYAYAVATTPDGLSVYVTGYTDNGTSGDDYATVAYDAVGGGLVGSRLYNGPANGPDYAYAIAVSSTQVFVTGESYGDETDFDYATAAYTI